jgi:hypothetical protein
MVILSSFNFIFCFRLVDIILLHDFALPKFLFIYYPQVSENEFDFIANAILYNSFVQQLIQNVSKFTSIYNLFSNRKFTIALFSLSLPLFTLPLFLFHPSSSTTLNCTYFTYVFYLPVCSSTNLKLEASN